MKPLPIRIKLTAWYSGILLVTFALFGTVAYFAMRKSIEDTVDEGLRDRADGIRELLERVGPEGPNWVAHQLREHSELRGEGDLAQVSDGQGRWLYRSEIMERYAVSLAGASVPTITNLEIKNMPLRILVEEVRSGGENFRVQVAAPMDDFDEALDRLRWTLLLLSPLLLAFASAGGYWLSRRALAPVDQITQAARSISHNSISNRLTVPPSGDELQRLSETLNGMLDRLEGAFKRITRFTGDASHELRTPVTVMRTAAELALRKPRSESEYREALAEILRELERTSTLIEKLMLLARADSGAEALQFVRVDLPEVLQEACRQGRLLAEAKGVQIRQQVSNRHIFMEGDGHALERLFLILLDNAVKYTPAGGQVNVSLSEVSGLALVEVRDTGIGISGEALPQIFERFYRADKARSREMGGIGLGLSIGKWITQAHGGVIEVESAPGQGSVFRVRLPASKI